VHCQRIPFQRSLKRFRRQLAIAISRSQQFRSASYNRRRGFPAAWLNAVALAKRLRLIFRRADFPLVGRPVAAGTFFFFFFGGQTRNSKKEEQIRVQVIQVTTYIELSSCRGSGGQKGPFEAIINMLAIIKKAPGECMSTGLSLTLIHPAERTNNTLWCEAGAPREQLIGASSCVNFSTDSPEPPPPPTPRRVVEPRLLIATISFSCRGPMDTQRARSHEPRGRSG